MRKCTQLRRLGRDPAIHRRWVTTQPTSLGAETTSSGNTSQGLYSALGSRGANTLAVPGYEMREGPPTSGSNGVTVRINNNAASWSAGPSSPGYSRPDGVSSNAIVTPLIPPPKLRRRVIPAGSSGQFANIAAGLSSGDQAPQRLNQMQPSPQPFATSGQASYRYYFDSNLSTAWSYLSSPRVGAAIQLAGAGFEASLGAGLIAAPEPVATKIGGYVLIAHAGDNALAALETLSSTTPLDGTNDRFGRFVEGA